MIYYKEMMDYYQSKMKDIKRNYALAVEKNDYDGVHDMRVDLKRMKAFFNLVESINRDFKAKKNFAAFKKIAKSTGGLRDAQVQMKRVKKIMKSLDLDVGAYLSYLKKTEADNYKSFRVFSKTDPIGKLKESRKIISQSLKVMSPVRAETKARGRFFNLRNNLILLSSESDLEDDILHKVRILSKEAHFTIEIIHWCFHIWKDRKVFINEIVKAHKLLGDWHDLDVGIMMLNDFTEHLDESNSMEPFNLLASNMSEKKEKMSSQFRKSFDEFTQAALLYEPQT